MSDLNREGLEAAMEKLAIARTYTNYVSSDQEMAEAVVRAYLSSSQPLTDEEREALVVLIDSYIPETGDVLNSARAKLSREQS